MPVTFVSTDPREVVERVLQVPEKTEATVGGVAEESAETASESQTEQAENTQEEQRPSKRSQKVKRLAEKLTEAERERDEWKARAESPRREEQPKVQSDPFAYPVPKPKAEDFDKPQDFVEALSDWKYDARKHTEARQAEVKAQQDVIAAHYERVDETREKHADFDEALEEAGDISFRNEAAKNAFYATIFENEDGPEVLYHIAKHPEIMDSLAEMTPGQIAAKVGRIAASLSVTPEPQKQAPRLIKPVGGGSKRPDAPEDRSNLSHAEWKKLKAAGQIR